MYGRGFSRFTLFSSEMLTRREESLSAVTIRGISLVSFFSFLNEAMTLRGTYPSSFLVTYFRRNLSVGKFSSLK
nr:hypothetical protein Iba_chr06bCG16810 [Ipomoea batatas]GMD09011.1 hypothetical protein Iba_scaffold39905CG0010 [Ipomoea batatas]GMD09750.1 hypothetical protein Iba_chr06dCG11140 [Ipomoea batatas]